MADEQPREQRKLEFPANIAIRTQIPVEGQNLPTMCQIALYSDQAPIVFIFETPDPLFILKMAATLKEVADEMTANPANAEHIGCHEVEDVTAIDPNTLEAVGAVDAPSSPAPEAGEGE